MVCEVIIKKLQTETSVDYSNEILLYFFNFIDDKISNINCRMNYVNAFCRGTDYTFFWCFNLAII